MASRPARDRRIRLLAGLLAAALFLATLPEDRAEAAQDTNSTTGYHILTVPGSTFGAATIIANNGWITVYDPFAKKSTVWKGIGVPVEVSDPANPGAGSFEILDMNDSGVVVGTYDTGLGFLAAFRWSGSGFEDIGSPPGRFGGTDLAANGIDTAGNFTGQYTADAGTCENSSIASCGFYGTTGATAASGLDVFTDPAGGLDIGGNIVVGAGFTWTGGVSTPLPGGNGRHITESGKIAGWTAPGGGVTEAAYWSSRTSSPTLLGTLGGTSSFAWSVNESGTVVGWSDTTSGARHAFMWTSGGMVDLGTLPGGTNSEARDINDAGLIVGESDGVPVIWDPAGGYNPDYPPEIEPIFPQGVAVGDQLVVTPVISDPDGDAYTATWDRPPGAAQIGEDLVWTPTAGDIGIHTATLTVVQNSQSLNVAVESVSIQVTSAGPVLDPIGDKTATVGSELRFTVVAQGADLTYVIATDPLPAGVAIDPATGVFTWTPVAGQEGDHVLTIVASDRNGFDSETITVTVLPAGGGDVVITVVESITVVDSTTVSPPIAILVSEIISVVDDAGVQLPVEIFVTEDVVVEDAATILLPIFISIGETVTVSDTPTVNPSILLRISETVGVDEAITIEVLKTTGDVSGVKWDDINGDGVRDSGESGLGGVVVYADTDGDGLFDLGEPFTLTEEGTGSYLLESLDPGSHTIREVVPPGYAQTFPNGDGSHVVNVTANTAVIGVDFGNTVPVDLPPTIEPIAGFVVDEHTEVRVVPQITDPEGDPFTLSWSGVPEGAVINGIYIWTPNEEQGPGRYLVTVTATQNSNPSNSDSETFLIVVNEVDDPPVIEPIAGFVVDEGTELTVIPRVSDSDGDSYTIAWTDVPPEALLNGIYIWTPTEEQGPGQYTVTVTATQDSNPANSTSVTFPIVVNEVGGPPVQVPVNEGDIGTATAPVGGSVEVNASGLMPGSTASAVMYSEPVTLATGVVGPDGTFQVFVTIPEDTEPGLHRIVVVGLEAPGDGLALQNWILIVPALSECTVIGTNGNDWLFGTRGDDIICGLGGHDRLFGRGGNDILIGGNGRDVLVGGSGDDVLSGGAGRDFLFGNRGNDILEGGPGRDFLIGGPGIDTIVSPDAFDWVVDPYSKDTIIQ